MLATTVASWVVNDLEVTWGFSHVEPLTSDRAARKPTPFKIKPANI